MAHKKWRYDLRANVCDMPEVQALFCRRRHQPRRPPPLYFPACSSFADLQPTATGRLQPSYLILVATLPDKLNLNGHGRSFPMEHSMRTMTRTIALAFVLLGLASAPLAAQANPPPPSNPPGAQPTGPQYQRPPPQAPQAQSPQPQGPQY